MENAHNVQGIKIGKTLNVFIDGELHKKTFENDKDAIKAYKKVIKTQKNPTEDNIIDLISVFKGSRFKIAKEHGLEYNITTGKVYMDGFTTTELPDLLIKTFEDYSKNDFPVKAIENFWGLLMHNPDPQIRKDLFNYISTYNLVITEYGYFLAYKAVTYKESNERENDLSKFVQDKHNTVKNKWSTNPARYTVYESRDNEFMITKSDTFKKWDLKEKGVNELGNLKNLFENKTEISIENEIKYTDKHTKQMDIQIGEVCKMPRTKCDNDPTRGCSYGLHVGATNYVNSFSNSEDQILMCLINPAHVVAIPTSDTSKIRVSEYYPFSIAEKNKDGDIDAVDTSFFENDYLEYEKKELEELINNTKSVAIETSNNLETRENEELVKILENRIVKINE